MKDSFSDFSKSPALKPKRGPLVKLDALYKTILRRLRSILRTRFDEIHNVKTKLTWTQKDFF